MTKLLRWAGLVHLVITALLMAIVFCPKDVRSYGDRLQIALPLVAYGCALTSRQGAELALRFAISWGAAHTIKQGLGERPINARPYGGDSGFPSAHTTAAVVGASALVHDCVKGNPVAQALVIMGAAYVGASRIAVGAHDIWQVFAGALLGWLCERSLRRDSPQRRRVVSAFLVLRRQGGSWMKRLGAKALRCFHLGLVALALMIFALLLPIGAQAETELSVYTGVQAASHSVLTHSLLGSQRVGWKGKSFDAPPYYGLRAVWWRSATLGFGIEVNHAKVYADQPAAYGYDRLEFTDGMNLLTASVWRRFPNSSRWTPYIGAGLGVAVPHVDVQPTGQAHTFGYQLTGPAAQVVAGAAWRMTDKWSLFGEYKGSYSRHRAKLDSGGEIRTNIITNALNLGVSFRF